MKKFLTLLLTVALTATLAITGTVAYLTDTDSDVNTMTLGNVKIEQIEQERDASGNLVAFTQGKPAYPAVGNAELTDKVTINGVDYGVYSDALKNELDKFITVKNTGKSDAFVRTIVAIEAPGYNADGLIHMSHNPAFTSVATTNAVINGTEYVVCEFTYADKLAPKTTSVPSLLQLYLDSKATNEDCAKFGSTWDVLVLSQAVQTEGFTTASEALIAGFGEFNSTNVATWFSNIAAPAPTVVDSVEDLKEALENNAENIIITDNISGDLTIEQAPAKNTVIDGNGKTFEGNVLVDGKSGTFTDAGFTIKNLTFTGDADSIPEDACIQLGDGTTGTRYTCNVTIENCVFDIEGKVGIKSYTGGDKNLTIRNCTATEKAHSLAQLTGVDGVLVEDCTMNSVRGINFNNSTNITVNNCTIDVQKYGLRFGAGSAATGATETYLVKNCTIVSDNVENDGAIVLRGSADKSTLTLENTTITATTDALKIVNDAVDATVIQK